MPLTLFLDDNCVACEPLYVTALFPLSGFTRTRTKLITSMKAVDVSRGEHIIYSFFSLPHNAATSSSFVCEPVTFQQIIAYANLTRPPAVNCDGQMPNAEIEGICQFILNRLC